MAALKVASLHWSDYLVFAIMLTISLGIGIYHALSGGKQKTTGEYLLGNRAMGLIPVTLSLVVTYISTITLIGYPAEMFAFGVQYYWFTLGVLLGIVASAVLFVPLFYPLQITSVNEYLWLRYESRTVQYIGTVCSVGNMIFYLGNVYYGPAVSIEAMCGFPSYASIFIIGAVSIFYTAIGGFKAVVWTDVFQSTIMFAGMIAVLAQGLVSVGGFENMWNHNSEWGRLNFFDFDPDPLKRMNFWGAVFGNALSVLAIYGYWQTGVQRYLSMPTISKAKWCLIGMVPGNILMQTLAFLCGLTLFAYYAQVGCDPKEAGIIERYDQIMPYFVATIFSFPVIPGLFLAALYAASLSSASTLLNGVAACVWKDIISHRFPDMAEWKATAINKLITFVVGVVGVILALAINGMKGGTLVQIISTFGAAAGGPNFALFVIGAFFPWITWKAVTIASVFGGAFGIWISIGNYLYGASWAALPSPTHNCSAIFNTTLMTSSALTNQSALGFDVTTLATSVLTDDGPTGINRLYSLSFLWIREAITAVTVVLAFLFTICTGVRKASTVEEQFVHPMLRRCVKLKKNSYMPVKQEMEKIPMEQFDQKTDVTAT